MLLNPALAPPPERAIRSNRKAMVAVNLKLTDDEAAKFWPVYDR